MLQDRLAGKPLELDCLTGAVIEIAAQVGVEVPQTRAVHDLLTAFGDLGDPWTSRRHLDGQGRGT